MINADDQTVVAASETDLQERFYTTEQYCHPRQMPIFQGDKEATGLSRVQHFAFVCNPAP